MVGTTVDVPAFLADQPAASDPARDVIDTILALVPVSHWSFARPRHQGASERTASAPGNAPRGPHIEAMHARLASYASGLTLHFADSRTDFGALHLLRTAELGPFASSEIRALTFALDAACELFSTLRLMESQEALDGASEDAGASVSSDLARTHDSALYVLDRELRIVLAWSPDGAPLATTTSLRARLHDRLPAMLENVVRELTERWTDDIATHRSGAARPVPFLVVRTQALAGQAGSFVGVAIERVKSAHSITRAAAHFGISPREAQVLALLLDGAHLREVGARLYISSSTVQDHIKRLLQKTGTRNRSEMIARVLRWR